MLSVGKFFLLLLNLYGMVCVSVTNYAFYFMPYIRFQDLVIDLTNIFAVMALPIVLSVTYMFPALCIDHFSQGKLKFDEGPLFFLLSKYFMLSAFVIFCWSLLNILPYLLGTDRY